MKRIINKFNILILTTIILVFLLFLGIDTISYFKNSFLSSGNVTAATYEDIIQSISFEKNGGEIVQEPSDYVTNPINILVSKGAQYNPIIHFSLEGDIKDYILHIDSSTLDENQKTIPIKVNVNLRQFLDKIFENTNDITGKIHVRYLNDYFTRTYKVKLSRNYIVNKFLDSIDIEQMGNIGSANKYNRLEQIIQKIQEYLPVTVTGAQFDELEFKPAVTATDAKNGEVQEPLNLEIQNNQDLQTTTEQINENEGIQEEDMQERDIKENDMQERDIKENDMQEQDIQEEDDCFEQSIEEENITKDDEYSETIIQEDPEISTESETTQDICQ